MSLLLLWRHSVEIPLIMPKPDVVALTGGYRKTPILQIGADILCDTKIIASAIESLSSIPPLEPKEVAASAQALSFWADTTLFGIAVGYLFQPKVRSNKRRRRRKKFTRVLLFYLKRDSRCCLRVRLRVLWLLSKLTELRFFVSDLLFWYPPSCLVSCLLFLENGAGLYRPSHSEAEVRQQHDFSFYWLTNKPR